VSKWLLVWLAFFGYYGLLYFLEYSLTSYSIWLASGSAFEVDIYDYICYAYAHTHTHTHMIQICDMDI
jgi:hypothetical protein